MHHADWCSVLALFVVAVLAVCAPAGAQHVTPSPADSTSAGEPGGDVLDAASDGLDVTEDDGELDLEAIADLLLREARALRQNPIDVNTASLSELLRVPYVGPGVAMRILNLRRGRGPFGSLEDLVASGVMPVETLALVRPYIFAQPVDPASGGVRSPREAEVGASRDRPNEGHRAAAGSGAGVGPPASEGAASPIEPRVRWSLRARVSGRGADAESTSAPTGSATDLANVFARLRVSYRDLLDLGVSCERDPGEASLTDHTALYVKWTGARRRARAPNAKHYELSVGLGDFTGAWAQGLIMRSCAFTSPGAYPLVRDRLEGYDGASETIARRGVFITLSRGAVSVDAVCARTALDATINEDGLASSIRQTGYHRTEGEKSAEGALTERLWGARVRVAPVGQLRAGASVLTFEFDPPLGSGDPERQRFRFAGDALVVGGADLAFVGGGWRVGIEGVGSENGAAALAACRLRAGGARVGSGLAYVSRAYWSPLGGGVPGCSSGTNGVGAWVGAEYGKRGSWQCWLEVVVTGRPWRSYNTELPDGSTGVTLGIRRPLGKSWDLRVETRRRARTVEEAEPERTAELSSLKTKVVLTGGGSWPVSLSLLRSTSGLDGAREGELTGFGARLDRDVTERWSLTVGVTTVTRRGSVRPITLYEPGLPGAFSLRALNVPGTRWYIRSQLGLLSRAALTARIGGGPEPGWFDVGIGLDLAG